MVDQGQRSEDIQAPQRGSLCCCKYMCVSIVTMSIVTTSVVQEHSLTYEVLRKLSPLEAELLKDPSIRARIKFRFSGPEFPPFILFKIFTSTQSDGAGGVCYLSGRKMIKPASVVSSCLY